MLLTANSPLLADSMSIILPGVQTMISQPRFNSAICSEMPVPPYTHTTCSPSGLVNLRHSVVICKASSRVGVMITAETSHQKLHNTELYLDTEKKTATEDATAGHTQKSKKAIRITANHVHYADYSVTAQLHLKMLFISHWQAACSEGLPNIKQGK